MLSPEQCRAARAWLNWSQEELAKEAEVALSTVRDFERGDREPIGHNIQAIQRALEAGGIEFQSGAHSLSGIKFDPRIKEKDTYIPILRLLDESPDGFMKTADLIKALEMMLSPSGEDNKILAGRHDTRFSQIVRNVVSHRATPTNLIGLGLVDYEKAKRGLRITTNGRFALVDAEKHQKTSL
jgi:transcriptional regulator with XRE-family HTH domain